MPISEVPWTTTHGWIYDADGELVGICWGRTPEETEDNAQLISAAPEMLGALEGAKWLIESYVSNLANNEEYQDICAVIKKARGEE